MNPCKSCGEITKYECISCRGYVCLRPECSVAEPNEYLPGWQEFKSFPIAWHVNLNMISGPKKIIIIYYIIILNNLNVQAVVRPNL